VILELTLTGCQIEPQLEVAERAVLRTARNSVLISCGGLNSAVD